MGWLLASGALGACSVSSPLTVRSTGSGIAQERTIALTLHDADDESDRARFGRALADGFAQRGLSVSSQSGLVADYAVSVSPASIGAMTASGEAGGAQETEGWLLQPRERERFDECDAMRLRGHLVVLDRATGATLYRGEGSAIECDFQMSDLEALALGLVDEMLAQPGASPP